MFQFEGLLQGIVYEGEYIRAQNDTDFTNKLDGFISDLMDKITLYGVPDKLLRKNKHTDELCRGLEVLMYERFGVPIRIIGSEYQPYSISLIGSFNSTITDYASEISEQLEELRTKTCGNQNNKLCTGTPEDIDEKEIFKNSCKSKLLGYMYDGIKSMNELFGSKKISIDWDKAYINGLDALVRKKKVPIIGLNLRSLFIEYGLSVKEIGAIFLHEYGHVFNTISYASFFTKTALPAFDSFTDDKIPDQNKMLVSYKFITGKEETLDEVRKKYPVELLKFLNNAVGKDSAFYNSEITADRFATKLGYGEYLVNSLKALGLGNDRSYAANINITLFLVAIVVTVLLIIYTAFIPFQLVFYILLYIPIIMTSSVQNIYDEHEQAYNRFRRIKLDLIRDLRTGQRGVDEDAVRSLTNIMDILEEYAYDKKLPQLIMTYLLGHSTTIGYHELYQRLEQLSENDLHYLSMKMKKRK